MTKNDRVLLGAIFIMLFIVVVLQAGIYWNTKPQEEYEVITVIGTVNTTALEEAGYFSIEKEGYIEVVEEDSGFHRGGRCEICEAIQSGELTLTSENWTSDNFNIIMKDESGELQLYIDGVRGREE